MEASTLIGSFAGILTTLATVPQFVKSLTTKKTKDVSLGWCVLLSAGVVLWLVYGIMIEDMPIIIANVVTLFFVLGILFLKLRHG
jgi:MtN3 and saliva related transmembrane protein